MKRIVKVILIIIFIFSCNLQNESIKAWNKNDFYIVCESGVIIPAKGYRYIDFSDIEPLKSLYDCEIINNRTVILIYGRK